jgi:hypothetical protein
MEDKLFRALTVFVPLAVYAIVGVLLLRALLFGL